MQKKLKSICIVGGGTAGWMAATLLSSALRGSNAKITVIESPDIETIGVGESTVPSIMDFIKACQIDLKEFIQATSATFKLGIRFDDWLAKETATKDDLSNNKSYFHPFGRIGKNFNGFDFYQTWLKSLADGHETRWVDHSPSAIMAEQERFMLRPQQTQDWVLSSYAHALHLDSILVARYLRNLCSKRGVTRIEATVKNVTLDKKSFIESLELENGTPVSSDFFIDCTGFKALLIEKSLKIEQEDWSHYLPCNRAVTVQTEQLGSPVPYTVATALDAGWSWKIPLQHRTGNGYVYSSQHCSDEEAIKTLVNSVSGKLLNEPRIIPFATGKRKKIWHNNCLALGLSGGFLEPLESTAIHLVYKTLFHFIKNFPDMDFDPHTEQAFNDKINVDYEEIRDFIILHYSTSNRSDTQFWRWCQTMPVPESLSEKIRLFRERGEIDNSSGQFFSSDSWYSILEGMKIRPRKYHPLIDGFDRQDLAKKMDGNVTDIKTTVLKIPNHHDYIRAHCQVNKMS